MNRLASFYLTKQLSLARNARQTQNIVNTCRYFSEDKTPEKANSETENPQEDKFDALIPKQRGFAQAYKRQEELLAPKTSDEPPQTFAALLRNSAFIDVSCPH